MADKLMYCTSPMMIHKINPSVDQNNGWNDYTEHNETT